MERMRHIGKLINTDQRCVVAFMQIPNREDHALVIPVEALPARYEQAVMDTLKSAEGQNEETFAFVLSRRIMPDTGKDILATLHATSMLMATPCSNVVMLPMPNQPTKLTDILVSLGRLRADDAVAQREKFNPYDSNRQIESSEGSRGIANNLLYEAKMLEDEAQKKRELAYSYVPSLRPAASKTFTPTSMDHPYPDSVVVNTISADSAQLSLDALLHE